MSAVNFQEDIDLSSQNLREERTAVLVVADPGRVRVVPGAVDTTVDPGRVMVWPGSVTVPPGAVVTCSFISTSRSRGKLDTQY